MDKGRLRGLMDVCLPRWTVRKGYTQYTLTLEVNRAMADGVTWITSGTVRLPTEAVDPKTAACVWPGNTGPEEE